MRSRKFPISKLLPKTSKLAFKIIPVYIILIDTRAKMDFKFEAFQGLISAKSVKRSITKTQSYLSDEIFVEVLNTLTSQELFEID